MAGMLRLVKHGGNPGLVGARLDDGNYPSLAFHLAIFVIVRTAISSGPDDYREGAFFKGTSSRQYVALASPGP